MANDLVLLNPVIDEPAPETGNPRLKRMLISGDFLLHKLFSSIPRPYTALEQLPEDAQILGVKYKTGSDQIEILIASMQFPEVADDEEIPEHRLVLTGNYAQMRYTGRS